MTPVIELLKTYDKQFREFTITGTKTDKDDNLVSVRESPYWRLLKGTERTRPIPMFLMCLQIGVCSTKFLTLFIHWNPVTHRGKMTRRRMGRRRWR